MNLCIVNEDRPQCNVPRKTIKACPGRGRGIRALSLTWRAATQPLFLHGFSVVRVYVCSNTETSTADLAGRDLRQLVPQIPTVSLLSHMPFPSPFTPTRSNYHLTFYVNYSPAIFCGSSTYVRRIMCLVLGKGVAAHICVWPC